MKQNLIETSSFGTISKVRLSVPPQGIFTTKWQHHLVVAGEAAAVRKYCYWILYVIKHAMPKAVNYSKLYKVQQEPQKSSAPVLERIKMAAQKYTNLNPEKEDDKKRMALIFNGQSFPDIRQKFRGDDPRNLSTMLEVAWTVFNNGEKIKEVKQI